MNYRHSFHAGNHADVLKHVALLELLRLLTAKDKPLAYLDSHAGAGGYLLADADAAEWRTGVGRIWTARQPPAAIERYLDAVREWNPGSAGGDRQGPDDPAIAPRRYPGSPALAAAHLRPQDRLRLCETQPDVAEELRRRLATIDPRVSVLGRDGYGQALKALLPPPERRGLILIDPPYEAQQAEFYTILAALGQALRRFATGVYAIWYPIKQANTIAPFLRALAALPAARALTVELWIRATDSPLRLNGSGLAVLNPPWRFVQQTETWLPWLSKQLADGRGAGWRCHWLKREAGAH